MIRSGHEFLREDAGVIARVGGLDLKSAVAFQHVDEQFHNFRIIVHDQDFLLAAVQGIRRNAVVLHECDQGIARNSAEPAARHAKAPKPAAVKTANDRLLRNLADLRSLAGGENPLHSRSRSPIC